MNQKELKIAVLKWLKENNLEPLIVRTFNSKRYGVEVRCYCPPMVYVSNRTSHRKVKGTETDLGYTRTTGRHTIKTPMYISVNEKDLANDECKKFILDMVKDSCILKK